MNAPVRLVASTLFHSASAISSGRLPMLMPALLIRISSRPNAPVVAATMARQEVSSATSTVTASAVPPRSRMPLPQPRSWPHLDRRSSLLRQRQPGPRPCQIQSRRCRRLREQPDRRDQKDPCCTPVIGGRLKAHPTSLAALGRPGTHYNHRIWQAGDTQCTQPLERPESARSGR